MAQLPSGKFNAILRGKGAVAQALQKAVALGTRSVYIEGENGGVVNTGFLFSINNYYSAVGNRKINKRDLAKDIHAYLEWIKQYSDEIAVMTTDALPSRQLERVFVSLPLIEPPENEPTPCEQLLARSSQHGVVVLAEAGQGKSVILLHLAHQLAQHLLTKRGWDHADALRKTLGFENFKQLAIPFYLPLNVFAEEHQKTGIGLREYLNRHLEKETFKLPSDFFSAMIEHDKPTVLLLDGLDEILDPNLRERVAEHLCNLSYGKHRVRFVVSCRPSAYRGNARMNDDFRRVEIAPFDDSTLEKIIRLNYVALFPDAKTGQDAKKTNQLREEIKLLEETQMKLGLSRRLIDSPLMTTLALIVREHTSNALPSRRADFLRLAVETLLTVSYDRDAKEREYLQKAVGGWQNHQHWLGVVAEWLTESRATEITEPDLRDILKNAHADQDTIEALIQFAQSRGGVLRRHTNGRYGFVHNAIQAVLAAWRWVESGLPADEMIDRLIRDGRILDETWREMALLIAGLRREHPDNKLGDNKRLNLFVTQLAARSRSMTLEPKIRFACAEIALHAAEENIEANQLAVYATLTSHAANLIEDDEAMACGELAPRLFIGNWLTRKGDVRQHALNVDAMRFCFVPPGPFWMGSESLDAADAMPQHKFDIEYPYWIGRYPITNAQFNAFVTEKVNGLSGYANPEWWKVAIRAGRWDSGQMKLRVYTYSDLSPEIQSQVNALNSQERFLEANRLIFKHARLELKEIRTDHPYPTRVHQSELEFDKRVSHYPNHPVIGITWYEALAFCEWLQARWRELGWLSDDLCITLPNEPEWEKAARGGIELPNAPIFSELDQLNDIPSFSLVDNPMPKREYAWGDDDSPNLANTKESGVNFTTPIGCFNSNVHPYGCQDMSGNALEWTRSLYGRYDYDRRHARCDFPYPYKDQFVEREDLNASIDMARVLRGGSYLYDSRVAGGAFRYRNLPDYRDLNTGFRLVARPSLSPSELWHSAL